MSIPDVLGDSLRAAPTLHVIKGTGVFPRSDSDAVCTVKLFSVVWLAAAVAIHSLRDISVKVDPRAAGLQKRRPSVTVASL